MNLDNINISITNRTGNHLKAVYENHMHLHDWSKRDKSNMLKTLRLDSSSNLRFNKGSSREIDEQPGIQDHKLNVKQR